MNLLKMAFLTEKSIKCFLGCFMLISTCVVTGFSRNPSDHPLLQAMNKELKRSIKKLRMPQFEKPYFISYLVREKEAWRLHARDGTVISESPSHNRRLYVEVRVGSYDLDNSPEKVGGFHSSGANSSYAYEHANLSLDDDLRALKRSLWLITDFQYKEALSALASKRAKKVYQVEKDEKIADFSKEEAHKEIETPIPFLFDRDQWRSLGREMSSIISRSSGVFTSGLTIDFRRLKKVYVNSEGSEIVTYDLYLSLWLSAKARAEDGMPVESARQFYVRQFDHLPSPSQIKEAIDEMVEEVRALQLAPVMNPYTGPAILDPDAAGVLFHEAVGHRLEGERQKDESEGQTFKGKLNERIIPEFLSISDDPTLAQFGDMDLNGHYRFDDEGIPAKKAVLIDKGILRGYLLSRSPVKGFKHSNGHGRSSDISKPIARMANLIVESTYRLSQTQLREKLLEIARDQDKKYALIIRRMYGGDTQTRSGASYQAFRGIPRLVYRVNAQTGEEELVRGVEVVGTPLIFINKIVATGNDPEVFNGFCGAESGYVPLGQISPSILISELELQRSNSQKQKAPLLSSP